ncbi:MAG TPA: di-heme oxidoredictase family protein, partial [Candidatus Angelobacter sp.]|nr:di-heme oxidoredictase family protein [Candidatus Angelobacter sp.]
MTANNPVGILDFFNDGLDRFQNVEAVSGTDDVGLGPRFNMNQCSICHSQPAIGGTGPASNPEFKAVGNCANGVAQTRADQGVKAVACSTTNTTPSFITANGPTREARFPFFFNANGTVNTANPNGGVESLFTVSGRPDGATNCSLTQPSFAAAAAANNLIFRIPTPLFGTGLLENLDDSTLLINRNKNLANNLGIAGDFNRSGNDNTISRFGWKAQNKSLHIFAGEAYNVEMGITNLIMPNERALPGEDGNGGTGGTGLPASCLNLGLNGYPEDSNNPGTTGTATLDDASAFANFMRLLAPPAAGGVILNGVAVTAASIANGKSLFSSVGCATCHNSTLGNTQPSNVTPGLGGAAVNAFTDLEFHHMGTVLNDNV